MPKIPPRLAGIGLIVASGVSTLAHRAVWEAARHGPPQLAEAALGLVTFVLASTGILLFIHGAALFRRDAPVRSPFLPSRPVDVRARFVSSQTTNARWAFDTREGVLLAQARHVIAASRVRVAARSPCYQTDERRPAPYRR